MKKGYLLMLTLFFTSFSAQKKDTCKDIINRWNGWDIYKKPSVESVKKCLSKDERNIKIEVINKGDYSDFTQVVYVSFTKVNNGNFSAILKNSENLPNVVIDKLGNEEWRDKNNGLIDKNSLEISQIYTGAEDTPNLSLKEVEIYETNAPILSGTFRILGTHRKDFEHNRPIKLTKTINIYSNNKLIISKDYPLEEIEKIGNIELEFNAVQK